MNQFMHGKTPVKVDVETLARRALSGWIMHDRPTIGDLLKALEKAGNKKAAEELQKKWGISRKSGIIACEQDVLCVQFFL